MQVLAHTVYWIADAPAITTTSQVLPHVYVTGFLDVHKLHMMHMKPNCRVGVYSMNPFHTSCST